MVKRDYYAGGLMLLLGVGAAVTGAGYKFGSLARMGPGFMPVMLGIVLAFLGILIAGIALGSPDRTTASFCRITRNGSAGSALSAAPSCLSSSGSMAA